MFYYETHVHTEISSRCSRFSPENLVDFYVKNGYSGVFITDHFLNGNCVDELRSPDMPYEDKIRGYAKGYKRVKELAGDKLQVFFGIEYSYKGTDVLVYGLNEDDLIKMPEIMQMTLREFINFANGKGALTIQAHPFREAGYIDHIRLFPDALGVEVFNAMRDERTNRLAEFYCSEYNKIKFSGTDNHGAYIPDYIGGMAFTERIKDEKDFIKKVLSDKGIPVRKKTVF